MIHRAAVSLLAISFSVGSVVAQEPEYEMTTYQFALLVRVADQRPMGEREIVAKQEAHVAYLSKLTGEGKVLLAGPLAGGGEIDSVVVLNVGSVEAAETILSEDPWVSSGRLAAQVHPWWAAKDILRKPPNLRFMSVCYLGLLKRPADAPEYSEERLREIQEGHMANIQSMADSGDLVIAGPMGDYGPLRGIFVFRTTDAERIRTMVARDPAVKAGRLGVELYPWHVPRGSLPDR